MGMKDSLEEPIVDPEPLLAKTAASMSALRRNGSSRTLTTNLSGTSLSSLVPSGYNGMSQLVAMDLEMYAAHKKKMELTKGQPRGLQPAATFAGELDRIHQ